ncbi:LuxR C-terminal-related transcriptional regulator [Virgisporangium ochraceum]|uniref:LuxR family transcriptional regulator n=1 Tax=Virgisporangium ochraceum TaxID=65505 RepID=A0A8J4A534_9ACTN|nr:LuxR C-terminal-related transcriptional regulator [Virgisporangium ochraceum]GIJ75271.1 LuxR family transcriptional regulator [Virgisporangium ochraceum]
MGEALVRTKLTAPRRRPELVERARLTERLAHAREAALVLVSAPAGFGKTTLLASVLGDAPDVAWVSLDARDADATRFWLHVLHALEVTSAGCASTALALLDTGPGSLEDVVTSLVNEVSVRSEDLTLVLDDYHLAESREVTDSLSLLLEHRPPQLHLVVSTRADPVLPLSRLRARGDLVELRAADLRLTLGEVRTYLNGIHDLGLSAEHVQALESRTEGWAAALQLAALSLRGRTDVAEFISSFAGDHRYIVDYLIDEVLDQQPPLLRRFLLDTSVLEALCGPLCDAVTGPVDGMPGAAVLEALERRNLLVVPLDDHRRWYRYHHLFSDVLHMRLMAERPGDVRVLHGRASDWYEAAGDVEAAVRHAFAAGDTDRAADLIEIATPELRRRRAEGLLRTWVPLVPAEVLARRPVLASNLVGALMASNTFDGVAERLDSLSDSLATSRESLIIRDRHEWQRVPAVMATHRAALALIAGDVDSTLVLADEAVARAAEGDELTYASASALKGLASWSTGDLSSAREAYLAATEGLAAQGHVSDALGCTVTVVELELQLGDLDAAHTAAQRALDLAAGGDGAVRGTADMWVALARVAWERGNSDDAARYLSVAGDLGEAAGLPQQPYRWRVAMAAVREAQGDAAAADVLLDEAERLFNSDFSPNVRPVSAVRARLHLRIGDLAAARRWAAAAPVAAGDDLTYLHEYEHLTLARLLLAEHAATPDPARVEQALAVLQHLHDAAADAGRTAAVLETSLLLALAYDTVGRPSEALRRLQDAVDLTSHRGWVRPLLDAGPRIVDLLTLLPDRPLEHVLAAAATGSPSADAPRSSTTSGEAAPLVAPLSSRELDVLRLLGSDLDGPAIARHLNVSLPTVRTHTQHIYAKLGVNNRRAAVRRAHQLHL